MARRSFCINNSSDSMAYSSNLQESSTIPNARLRIEEGRGHISILNITLTPRTQNLPRYIHRKPRSRPQRLHRPPRAIRRRYPTRRTQIPLKYRMVARAFTRRHSKHDSLPTVHVRCKRNRENLPPSPHSHDRFLWRHQSGRNVSSTT